MTLKTTKSQIVAIVMLMATVISCDFGGMPHYGWCYESISMRVTSEELGFDNELFYRDSIYRQGDSYNTLLHETHEVVFGDNGDVYKIETDEYSLRGFDARCYASSSDSIRLNLHMELFIDTPWEIGYTHHFHIVDYEDIAPPFGRFSDFVYVEIDKLRSGDVPQILSIGSCDVEGWIRLTSFRESSIPGHTDLSGEFEVTLTHREDSNKRIYITNGTFENVAFDGKGIVDSTK